jgi:hypothetical protein
MKGHETELAYTCREKSSGEGFMGWKLNRYKGLVTDLALPSTSTTWMFAVVSTLGKADDPRGGWLAQSK